MLKSFGPFINYADPVLERSIGIAFRKPRKDEISRVREEVATMVIELGKIAWELETPPKGFLSHDLTTEQRSTLNEALGLRYAEHNIAQQDEIVNMPIRESGENMVHLPGFLAEHGIHAAFSRRPFHEACGSFAGKERIAWVRRSVAELMADAFAALAQIDLQPFIEDCWRPPEVQKGLYRRRIEGAARSTKWNAEQIEEVTTSLTAAMPGLAGHQAGAAIDWRIQGRDGKLLDLGNNYAEGKPVSSIDFPYVTFEQWRTRTIFKSLMQAAGLKLLATEDWHASYGDRGMSIDRHARRTSARYGPIKGFDKDDGAIAPYPPQEIDTPFFTIEEIDRIVHDARSRPAAS